MKNEYAPRASGGDSDTRDGYALPTIQDSPAWCALADGDPRKLLALAEFGEHHALRVETAQQAMAGASRAVADAADWPEVARDIQRRNAASC
jgi:hypothetical protein